MSDSESDVPLSKLDKTISEQVRIVNANVKRKVILKKTSKQNRRPEYIQQFEQNLEDFKQQQKKRTNRARRKTASNY